MVQPALSKAGFGAAAGVLKRELRLLGGTGAASSRRTPERPSRASAQDSGVEPPHSREAAGGLE